MKSMLDIIYEDKDKIVVNKPAGQLSQSGKSFDLDLVSEVMAYRKGKGEPAYAAIINRLDRPVSGLVVMAKNKAAAAKLSNLAHSKVYYAVICGKPEENEAVFVDYLVKNRKDNTSFVADKDTEGAKEARLSYKLLKYNEELNVSLVRIELLTGRHHQIRVQFASRNMPLVGDFKYLDNLCQLDSNSIGKNENLCFNNSIDKVGMQGLMNKIGIKRNTIALCSCAITVGGLEYTIEAPFTL